MGINNKKFKLSMMSRYGHLCGVSDGKKEYTSNEVVDKLNDLWENNELQKENQRLIKMLDNVANYMQKQYKNVPLPDFVEWWNNIVTGGLEVNYFDNDLKNEIKEHRKKVQELSEENNKLHEVNKVLEKQLHLVHMSSMFSTVKSFKGDISKRYKYNEETDTIYDTANNYGQYSKILDKKEITMLLNEYETLLKED